MDSDFLDPGKRAITGGTLGPKSAFLKIGVGNYSLGLRFGETWAKPKDDASFASIRPPTHLCVAL
jgi:hypothetical protein